MKAISFSRALILAVFAGVLALPAAAQIAKQSYQGHEAAANEVLIKFQQAPPNDAQAQSDVAATIQQEEAAANIDVAQGVGGQGWMLLHSSADDVATLMSMFTGAADVVHVEPNWAYRVTATPNDPYFYPQQWDMQNTGQTVPQTTPNDISCTTNLVAGKTGADVGATQAWNISTGTSGFGGPVVGVVDTGIDYNHPDLAANVWSAPSAYSFYQGSTEYTCGSGTHGWNTFTDTCDPMDDNGHGTHVSGTIGAVGNNGVGIAGVNWTTRIIAAKACDSSGYCYTSNLVDALQFLNNTKFDFGNQDGNEADIRVLNNSWGGGPFSQALLDAINATYQEDMLFVAAAGNNGSDNDTTPFYPASYDAPNVVAVAATTNTDGLDWFSNYGASSVQLGAPGDCILSTCLPGASYANGICQSSSPYAYDSGTSMATPHVAGVAGLSSAVCAGDTEWLKPNILNNVRADSSLSSLTATGGVASASNSLAAGSNACPGTGAGLVYGTEQSRYINLGDNQFELVYNSGEITLTVNGASKSVSYGEGSTSAVLATTLYNEINGDGTYPVRAHLLANSSLNSGGGLLTLSAKTTGSGTCYAVTTSCTHNSYFPACAFQIDPSGSALTGCK